jgi:hypothetical protein
METHYIIVSKHANYKTMAVVAPTGYCRTQDGDIKRDGTPSPEMGPIELAHKFISHRSAARTAGCLSDPIIKEVNY